MRFEQTKLSAKWEITHNLNHQPKVKCWVDIDGDLIRIIPEGVVFSDNHVEITLSKPYMGEVILVSSKAWDKE